MRICAINASLRGSRGVTHRLLAELAKGVQGAGGTWDLVTLAEVPVETCRGCLHCQAPGSLRCIFENQDGVRAVFDRVASADLVIYASPIYVLGLSSLLRRLLERWFSLAPVQGLRLTRTGLFFHEVDRQVCAKPFVSLLVCDNLEDLTPRNGRGFFQALSRFMDAPWVAHLERRSAAAWVRALDGPAGPEQARAAAILEAYSAAGRALAIQGRIPGSTLRDIDKPFIYIPILVRLARHLPFLRPRIERELQARAVML